jgi:hypothetical protein
MKKVLVIEDNRDNMRLITYALERSGYAVIGTDSGRDDRAGAKPYQYFAPASAGGLPVLIKRSLSEIQSYAGGTFNLGKVEESWNKSLSYLKICN